MHKYTAVHRKACDREPVKEYDMIRRQYYSDKEQKLASEMQEELKRLRAIAGEKAKAEEAIARFESKD